ncbi:MAG: hypothetical protein K2R98_08120 [Gemmataceae bacterium]|nr:hypothetical protein [Gemmataceae bacterium]
MIRKVSEQGVPESEQEPTLVMREVTDPAELAKARAQNERANRNAAWWQAHTKEIYSHRGKCVCIAGEEMFVADTALEAKAMGKAAHPDDDGSFVLSVPQERTIRIYAS